MYRLIWFQHIHKAAGTLVVNLARANREVLYPNNANGNPLDEEGNRIELWKLNSKELLSFVDKCERLGVTFVATEHGSPDFQTLHDDDRITLLTTLRDPKERAISNFNHAYYSQHTNGKNLSEFLIEGRFFMSDNHYVRIFSRKEQLPLSRLSSEDLEKALTNLLLFDIVLSISHCDIVGSLTTELSWSAPPVDMHTTFRDPWKIWNMIKKARVSRLANYIRGISAPGDPLVLDGRYDLDYLLIEKLFDSQ
mgnify:FL=1